LKMLRFIADENVPSRVVKRLRDIGHEVITVTEAGSAGIRNDELAELSVRLGRVVLTRDADFTRLRQPLVSSLKVIYIHARRDPSRIADLVSKYIDNCIKLLETQNITVLDEDGCHSA